MTSAVAAGDRPGQGEGDWLAFKGETGRDFGFALLRRQGEKRRE